MIGYIIKVVTVKIMKKKIKNLVGKPCDDSDAATSSV